MTQKRLSNHATTNYPPRPAREALAATASTTREQRTQVAECRFCQCFGEQGGSTISSRLRFATPQVLGDKRLVDIQRP
jgi:hypothetical protein